MTESPMTPGPAWTPAKPPWGFYETIGWGILTFILWFAAQMAIVVCLLTWQEATEPGSSDIHKMATDALSLSIVTILGSPVWIGAAAVAARWRGWRMRDYVALVPPGRRVLIFSIGCLLILLAASDLLSYALGRDVIPPFMIEAYTSARTPTALALLFVAIVVVAPVCEEVAFRGFLFRGLGTSRFGASGGVLLTAAAWSLMHVQYDWFVISEIFLLGLLFGWLRWASGSTLLTIVLHVIANFSAFMETAIKVEWLS